MKATLYKNNERSKTFNTYELAAIIDMIKKGHSSYPVNEFRQELSYCTPGTQPDIIRKLPAILFTATFRKKGGEVFMSNYNGIVLLEFNKLADAVEIEQIKKLAGEVPQTLAAFTGSGGRSVKVLVRACYPDGLLPDSIEKARIFQAHAYLMALQVYQPYIPFPVDIKEPVLGRGCRFTYDPGLYYAPESQAFILKQPDAMPTDGYVPELFREMPGQLERMLPGYDKYQLISTLYETSLQHTLRAFKNQLPDDRKPLLIQLARKCCQSGIPEEDAAWWTVCQFNLKDSEQEVRLTFRNTYTTTKQAGEKPCIRPEQSMAVRIDEFMKRRYEFRYNTQLMLMEYRKNRSACFYFNPINNRVLNSIALDALAEGLNIWDRDVKRYIYSDRSPLYSPLEYYLRHLPAWDGQDHIGAVSGLIPCSNPLWTRLFRCWFLAMVAQWQRLSNTHGNSLSPLLVGGQGTGKSTFCKRLLPPELGNLYTDRIDFSNKKDTELALCRFALINMDEFDQINSSHQAFLKHILQKNEVSIKLPHQSVYSTIPRYASFIATSNHTDLLTDTSGSRRFICIEVTGKIDNSCCINYTQLYAQAIHLLHSGEQYWLTEEEEAALCSSNEAFRQISPVEQFFHQYFRQAEENEEGEWLMASEILTILKKRSGMNLSDYKVVHFGRILKQLGILSKKRKQGYVYKVIKIEK